MASLRGRRHAGPDLARFSQPVPGLRCKSRKWRSEGTLRGRYSSQSNANSVDRPSATGDFPRYWSGR
jgi:hypothetical protein